MHKKYFLFILGIIVLTISILSGGCKRNHTPKPRGYVRIDLPEKEYTRYQSECPYTFLYPTYTIIEKDSSRLSEKCWININYKDYGGKIHISYKDVDGDIGQILEDTRNLAYKHTLKADAITEKVFVKPEQKVYGTVYEIAGNAASSIQFFLTDSTDHYLRGALYFNAEPEKDSLAPLINFVREDIIVLIESLEWK
ncbi:MAG: gliding motility lipoprotein GldD [Bacteroidales bacterium]|jgi:gliding motility-associated lipoprotein GldD|nr:gliding motility lipoprotein GldD [Bacteroidales bacterium]